MAKEILSLRAMIKRAAQLYLRNDWIQSAVDGLAVLLAVCLLDWVMGYPVAFRAAYLAPVYFAARRCSVVGESIILALTVLIGLKTDHSTLAADTHWAAALLIRIAIFGTATYVFHTLHVQIRSNKLLAAFDALTGAANRLALEGFARNALLHAVRNDTVTSVAMIDCDGFKALNDSFGHEHGDQVLKTLVETFKRELKGREMIARSGGDEFVLVMPGRDATSAKALLDRVLQRFEDETLFEGSRASFSYGIALAPEEGVELSTLLRCADRDMYCRKTLKAVVWSPELESVEVVPRSEGAA